MTIITKIQTQNLFVKSERTSLFKSSVKEHGRQKIAYHAKFLLAGFPFQSQKSSSAAFMHTCKPHTHANMHAHTHTHTQNLNRSLTSRFATVLGRTRRRGDEILRSIHGRRKPHPLACCRRWRKPRPLAGHRCCKPRPLAGHSCRKPRPLAGHSCRKPRPLAGCRRCKPRPSASDRWGQTHPLGADGWSTARRSVTLARCFSTRLQTGIPNCSARGKWQTGPTIRQARWHKAFLKTSKMTQSISQDRQDDTKHFSRQARWHKAFLKTDKMTQSISQDRQDDTKHFSRQTRWHKAFLKTNKMTQSISQDIYIYIYIIYILYQTGRHKAFLKTNKMTQSISQDKQEDTRHFSRQTRWHKAFLKTNRKTQGISQDRQEDTKHL